MPSFWQTNHSFGKNKTKKKTCNLRCFSGVLCFNAFVYEGNLAFPFLTERCYSLGFIAFIDYCGHRIKKPYNSCKDNEKLNPHSKSSVLLMKISTSRCLKHPWTLAQRYKWHMCLISYDKRSNFMNEKSIFCRFCYLLLNAIYGLVRKIFWNGEGG